MASHVAEGARVVPLESPAQVLAHLEALRVPVLRPRRRLEVQVIEVSILQRPVGEVDEGRRGVGEERAQIVMAEDDRERVLDRERLGRIVPGVLR